MDGADERQSGEEVVVVGFLLGQLGRLLLG